MSRPNDTYRLQIRHLLAWVLELQAENTKAAEEADNDAYFVGRASAFEQVAYKIRAGHPKYQPD